MSILGALKQHNSSIDDLAKLPQTMIMQMAQKKEISADMVAPILARKAEMMDAVARTKTMQQPEQAPPSVLEQLMAKNNQVENPMPMQSPMEGPMPQSPEQVGVGQLPVPERQYAGGGIVAFKRGGDLVDEEDDMDEEDLIAEYADAMKAGELAMMQQGASQGNAGTGIKYSDPMPRGGEAGLKDNASIRERLHDIVIGKESGGRRYAKDGSLLTSHKGALGERQVMPNTIRDPGFGIKAAMNDSPDEIARVGKDYLNVMYDRYKDPKTAMIAYNMGPGATDKWLKAGANIKDLPKETRGYISGVNLAEGGEIKHYQGSYESLVKGKNKDEENLTSSELRKLLDIDNIGGGSQRSRPYKIDAVSPTMSSNKKYTPDQLDAIARGRGVFPEGSNALPEAIPLPIEQAGLTPEEMAAGSTRAGTFEAMNKDETTGRMPMKPEAKTPEVGYFDKLMKQMGQERADLVKQKSEDRNMALLAAGLGMMGGTSSNAFTNIGQGGLSGMQYLSEANKQRAAQSAALSKNELIAQRYKELGETAKGNQAGMMAIRQGQLAVDQGTLTEKQKVHLYNEVLNKEKMAAAQAKEFLRVSPTAGFNAEDPTDIERMKYRILAQDPTYADLHTRYYGYGFNPSVAPTGNATMAQDAAAILANREKNKEKK
jgi:hypothetical protein